MVSDKQKYSSSCWACESTGDRMAILSVYWRHLHKIFIFVASCWLDWESVFHWLWLRIFFLFTKTLSNASHTPVTEQTKTFICLIRWWHKIECFFRPLIIFTNTSGFSRQHYFWLEIITATLFSVLELLLLLRTNKMVQIAFMFWQG